MPSSRNSALRARSSKIAISPDTIETTKSNIPYFAHQQLDPIHYHPFAAITLPIGKPGWSPVPDEVVIVTRGGWVDGTDAHLEEDAEDEISVQSPAPAKGKGHHTSQFKHNPLKRLKVAGGRPAVAKKITADLDSDDELIVRMKNAKYLEKDIAQRLRDEGRVKYNDKTIGTRYARLKRVLAQHNDELLDAELTDWHDGDDDALLQALQRAEEITGKAKRDAEARKWRIVADQLKTIKPVTNFSLNACRRRFESLQSGTAKPTPESIEDPDEDILMSIESRKEKERRIQDDAKWRAKSLFTGRNIEANAWSSRKSVT